MPVYDFQCERCGFVSDRYFRVAELDAVRDTQRCERCESPMKKLVSVPALRTTTRFMSGSDDGLPDEASRKIALAKARAAGVNVSGKKFHPGLCPKGQPFSPYAWYGDEAEVRKKAAALGRGIEGSINQPGVVYDHDLAAKEQPYRVAEHVVADDVAAEIHREHGGRVTQKKRRELIQKYQDKHSGNPVPKGKVSLVPK